MSARPLLRTGHDSPDQPSAIQLLPEEQKLEAIVCPCVSDQQSRTSEQTQLQSPCETTDTALKAGELWCPFWLTGARLSHSSDTLVVQTP